MLKSPTILLTLLLVPVFIKSCSANSEEKEDKRTQSFMKGYFLEADRRLDFFDGLLVLN